MQIKGIVSQVLPVMSGTNRNGGSWSRKEFVIQTEERYSKTVALSLMNGNIDKYPVEPGQRVTVEFDIESHEFNGRWYHSLTAWQVSADGTAANPSQGYAGR